MYMADMNNTHGHTNIVTHTAWHPFKATFLASSSLDSTVRVWDLHGRLVGVDKQLGHKSLHKARSQNYARLAVDTFTWASHGGIIVGGCAGGSLHLWETEKGNSVQAKLVNYSAHSGEITFLKFFKDDLRLVSRSMDNTVKLWDIRNLKKEVAWKSLECSNYRVQVDLSPDEKYLVTGTSPEERENNAFFKILDPGTLDEIESIPFEKAVVSVKWHAFFNQIFLGMADGGLKVLFTPHISAGGLVECLKKVPVEQESTEIEISKPIITPYSLSQFKVSYATKDKIHQRLREDHVLSQKPRGPLFDPAFDGRMSGINTVTQYILSSIHAKPRPEDDPREAILSYGPESQNPEWVNNAYLKTQPKPIFEHRDDSFPEKRFLHENLNEKCKSCGLKFCVCEKRRTKDEPLSGIEKRMS
jgi:WD40 repeat protein